MAMYIRVRIWRKDWGAVRGRYSQLFLTAIFDLLIKYDYNGWLVVEAEQDPKKANPLKYAKMARETIKKLGGI